MSRLSRNVAGLCNRAVTAFAQTSRPALQAAYTPARSYAVMSAATAGAAWLGSTMTMRVMGYNVPYPFIIGSAIAVSSVIYWYEVVHVAREKDAPLKAYVEAAPHIRTLNMHDQNGKHFTAQDLFGKWAVVSFGTLQSDANSVATMAKAAESVKQRSGSAVVPVFISLDPSRDTPAELKRFVGSQGSVGMVALTGDPDGLLSCANKFKKQEMSVRAVATKDQESVKHADTVDETYVSSYIYLVNPNGDFVSMMSKNVPEDKMANQICLSI